MFKKISKKGMLLFIGVMAVSAFAMPAMASAATWDGIGSTHVLDSSNPANHVSFSVAAIGSGWTCAIVQFHTVVSSPSDARVTGSSINGCMGTGPAVNCTVTASPTRLPWTVTNPSTADIRIDAVHVDLLFENTPGAPTACALPGNVTLTGSLNGGVWNQAQHEITFTGATGLIAHFAALGSSNAGTVTGTLRDTTQTLTLTG